MGYWAFGTVLAVVAGSLAIPFGLWDGHSLMYSVGSGAFIGVGIYVLWALSWGWARLRGREVE